MGNRASGSEPQKDWVSPLSCVAQMQEPHTAGNARTGLGVLLWGGVPHEPIVPGVNEGSLEHAPLHAPSPKLALQMQGTSHVSLFTHFETCRHPRHTVHHGSAVTTMTVP